MRNNTNYLTLHSFTNYGILAVYQVTNKLPAIFFQIADIQFIIGFLTDVSQPQFCGPIVGRALSGLLPRKHSS